MSSLTTVVKSREGGLNLWQRGYITLYGNKPFKGKEFGNEYYIPSKILIGGRFSPTPILLLFPVS